MEAAGPLPYTGYGDTSVAANDYAFGNWECENGTWNGTGETSGDQVFRFTAPEPDSYKITVTPEDFWPALYVVESCEDIANSCLVAQTGSPNWPTTASVTLLKGQTVFIIVDGYDSFQNEAGPYLLEIK